MILFAGLCCALAQGAEAETVVHDIRIGIYNAKTRLVLDLSERPGFKIFALANPYRIVLDLPDINWRVPSGTARRKGGLIAGLRYGQFQPGNSRVVMDLSGPGTVGKSFIIPGTKGRGPRLVIDIRKATRQAFLTTLKAPRKAVAPRAKIPLQAKVKRSPLQKPLVVIDPGHGGIDPGAIGVGGSFEKHVTLGMAHQIRRAIMSLGRQRV
ncbi:MAG: AMIN domain-containing protein, partial [Alphaproteobacteria bacterium]|nr:AMIN domain-containing protein [Alphaproteobacteria bacterium]